LLAVPQSTKPAIAEVLVGPIENPSNGHLYYAVSANTWTGAEAEAQSLDGHLVTINDEAENTWVWETFAPLVGGPVWIGLRDADQEGTFVWSSGEPANYFNWWCHSESDCEPNNINGVEDYVEMNNYVWNDNTNEPHFVGIVEVEEEPVNPEQATQDLINYIEGLNLPRGTENPLTRPLEAIKMNIEKDNTADACISLSDFLTKVNAFEGNGKLTSEQAGEIRGQVEDIQKALDC
jgi:hypothetical protein